MANNEATIVWGISKDSHLALALAAIAEKASRFGKGDYSVEHWAEDLLLRGLKTFDNYLDADKERRDKEMYFAAERKLTLPNPQNPADLARYAEAIMQLRRKYGIGGEKKQV